MWPAEIVTLEHYSTIYLEEQRLVSEYDGDCLSLAGDVLDYGCFRQGPGGVIPQIRWCGVADRRCGIREMFIDSIYLAKDP